MTHQLTVDVVSDVVCPWCFVGKHKLEAAAAAIPGLILDLRWRPFELDPSIPPGGYDRADYMNKKFGPGRLDAIHARLEAIGREAGIPFAFDKITRRPNTRDAHRLIRLAAGTALQTRLVERLFAAYFVDGLDVGDRAVLTACGVEVGLSRAAIESLFATDADAGFDEELAMIRQLGVSGVPLVIFTNEIVLHGVQEDAMFRAALSEAVRQAA
jgi:predicted DsbA family dithiol-disulfide isomerase